MTVPSQPYRVAIRADIDALHIHDAKQVDYRSQNEGVMHACGHDAHTATVFGAITALKALQASGELPWDVSFRGIFQPAEETCAGATSMIQAGALEDVSSLIAVHMDPTRRVGHVGFRAGVLTANCDEMEIVISGRGGHAARPHEASDPIAAAAQLVNALYLFIPRVTDSQDAVVVTIGKIDGGDHANVIPERVTLRGTIRTLDQVVRRKTMEHISRIASSVAQTSETKINVQFGLGCKSVVNDAKVVQILRLAARDVLEPAGVEEIPRPSMGSEDFAFYLEQVPGAMIRLGSTSDRVGGSGLHTPTFDIDEESLRIGGSHPGAAWSISQTQIASDGSKKTKPPVSGSSGQASIYCGSSTRWMYSQPTSRQSRPSCTIGETWTTRACKDNCDGREPNVTTNSKKFGGTSVT